MFRIPFLALATATLFAASPTIAPAKAGMDPQRLKQIPARIQEFVDSGLIAGAVTLVQRNGALASIEAIGYQDLESRKPMTAGTIFEIMSMTKPVTATAIMILMEEGRLSLSDPVEKYLPEFRGAWVIDARVRDARTGKDKELALKRPAHPITVRDLLTHTSGMPEMPGEPLEDIYLKFGWTLAEAVRFYAKLPLEYEPGTKWSYSNTGMATLGRIVEVVSGSLYEKFLDERIFAPLGMVDTFFFPPENKKARIASAYTTDEKMKLKNLGDGIYRKGAKYSMPEGGMYSTAADMANFYQMYLNKGAFNGKRILSKASVDLMTMVHTGGLPVWGSTATGYGLGWNIVRSADGALTLSSIGSYGHGGAFGTQGWVDPKTGLIGVLMIQKFPNDANDVHNAFRSIANAAVIE